jgi:hypothetical protein
VRDLGLVDIGIVRDLGWREEGAARTPALTTAATAAATRGAVAAPSTASVFVLLYLQSSASVFVMLYGWCY